MWSLPEPEKTSAETLEKCTSRIRKADLKKRLREAESEVVAAEEAFTDAATNVVLHTLPKSSFQLKNVTGEEMTVLYDSRMAKKTAPGRAIYDELLLAPRHGRCPLCGQRTVSTLDHHLPKVEYPALAIVPLNLVPSCSDCNKIKGSSVPTSPDDETLHPYFDDIESDLWLSAKVVEVRPPGLRFFVAPPPAWSDSTCARVQSHFRKFNLPSLYASQAAQELSSINFHLKQLLHAGGSSAVYQFLCDQAQSRRHAYLNSWQSATYTALSDSVWFCNGGFLE